MRAGLLLVGRELTRRSGGGAGGAGRGPPQGERRRARGLQARLPRAGVRRLEVVGTRLQPAQPDGDGAAVGGGQGVGAEHLPAAADLHGTRRLPGGARADGDVTRPLSAVLILVASAGRRSRWRRACARGRSRRASPCGGGGRPRPGPWRPVAGAAQRQGVGPGVADLEEEVAVLRTVVARAGVGQRGGDRPAVPDRLHGDVVEAGGPRRRRRRPGSGRCRAVVAASGARWAPTAAGVERRRRRARRRRGEEQGRARGRSESWVLRAGRCELPGHRHPPRP